VLSNLSGSQLKFTKQSTPVNIYFVDSVKSNPILLKANPIAFNIRPGTIRVKQTTVMKISNIFLIMFN
jgi:hypothetical protein